MTALEMAALRAISQAEIPIANPMALAAVASMTLPEARVALDALAKEGYIDWEPARRTASGIALSDPSWTVTAKGRDAFARSDLGPT